MLKDNDICLYEGPLLGYDVDLIEVRIEGLYIADLEAWSGVEDFEDSPTRDTLLWVGVGVDNKCFHLTNS